MRVCPHNPHNEATGSQLNLPQGFCISGVVQNLGNLMYLAIKCMKKYVELVRLPSLHAFAPGPYHLTCPKCTYMFMVTHVSVFCACTPKSALRNEVQF